MQASEINNLGTGRIYGDQISILAGSLNNAAETVNTGTGAAQKSAVIAARERLDIGASVITNQDGALLMSLGDMAIGKELDVNGKATGQADAFLNNSATVDVQGKLDINAGVFMNKDLYGTSVSGTTEEKYIVYTKVDPVDASSKSILFTGGKWDDHTGGARNCTTSATNTLCPTNEQWNALYTNPQTGGDATNATYVSSAGSWEYNDGRHTVALTTNDGDVFNHPLWRLAFVTKTTTSTGETSKDPASILVGGGMTLNANTAINDKSKIIVGGDLTVTADNLQNIGGGGSSVTTQHDDYWYSKVVGGTRKLTDFAVADWTPVSDYWSSAGEVSYNTVPVHTGNTIDARKDTNITTTAATVTEVAAAGTPSVGAVSTSNTATTTAVNTATATSATGNSTIGSNNTVASGAKATNVAAATGTAKPINKVAAPGGASLVVRTSNTAAKLPTNSLYIIQPTSANHSPKGYLVETDPRFTQNKQWLGSDYMLTQLGYDPALQTQRLGDGFYEQKLLREQVAQLTGRRFIDNNGESFTNDDEEYKALMNAGVLFAQQYGLIPGVALTAEQMALLTTDIVWLVEQEVTLPDGTKTKALVPQVYALVKPGDIDGSGNLISAKSIDLKLKGDMVNSGLMAARGNLSINANNISNLAGSIKGMDVSLMANNDIQSIQANIQAGNSLNIGAGRDVIVVAGNIGAGGNANITAGNNLILAAQERGSQLIESKDKFDANGNRINKDNYGRSGTYDQTGGTMNIGGSLNMSASNDFLAQGTQINAGGGVNISAGHNASITTAQKGSYYESVDTSVVRKKKWFGLAKTKTTTTITHTSTDIDNTVSTINGGAGSVNINAGNDVNIIGANISGASGVQVNAGNNTNILAAYNIHEHIDTKTVKTNGVGRFVNFIQGDLAPLIGIAPSFDRKPTDTSTTDINSTRTALLPTINGGSGNVSLTAGNVLTLQAPQITGGSFTFGGGGDQRTVAGDQIANALGAATDNQTASGGLDGLSGLVRGGITNNGADSKTRILMAVDSKEVSHTATSRSFIWQSSESSGSISQTAHLMNVNVPVGMTNFVGNGGISVQLPAGSKLPAQIAELAKQPGNEYLTDLANRSDIDWKRVDVINKTWDYKKEGLTAEAAIIVAIVVTILTAGAASSAGVSLASSAGFATTTTAAGATVMATAGGAAFAGAVTAGITTLATQAAIALINNKGDVGAAVKDLGSKENIKGLVTAMATAGLVQGLGDVITFPVGEAGAGTSMTLNQIAAQGGKATLVQSLGANLIKGVTSTVITTAINGGDLEDNLINSIKTAIITSVAAQGANAIGNAKLSIDGNDPLLNQFTATLAHAVLGCAAGSATAGKATGSGGGCAAGAGGAVIGELGAEWYGKTFPGATDADIANFAKLTTALAALPGGANAMTIAGVTSNNAVQNNYLNHTQWNKFAADIAACKAKASGCSASEEKAITAYYQDISTQQNIALANCEKTNNCTALKAEVALGTLTMSTLANTNQLPIGGAVGNDLGQSIGQRLANDPAYRQRVSDSIAVLNNCNANPSQCTEQAIKAAAIVVFPLLAPAGVGFTATGVIAGGSIGAAGNVAGQLVANGGQVSQINLTDAAMGAYTGALTYGATLWPSLFINVGGAVVTSAIKDDKPAGTGGSMAGAALGTGAGYFAGAGVQAGLDKLMNPWYKPVWQDLGLTIQTWIKPSPVPGVGGAVVGGVLQEGVNCGVNCPPTKPTVQVVK